MFAGNWTELVNEDLNRQFSYMSKSPLDFKEKRSIYYARERAVDARSLYSRKGCCPLTRAKHEGAGHDVVPGIGLDDWAICPGAAVL